MSRSRTLALCVAGLLGLGGAAPAANLDLSIVVFGPPSLGAFLPPIIKAQVIGALNLGVGSRAAIWRPPVIVITDGRDPSSGKELSGARPSAHDDFAPGRQLPDARGLTPCHA